MRFVKTFNCLNVRKRPPLSANINICNVQFHSVLEYYKIEYIVILASFIAKIAQMRGVNVYTSTL